MNPLLANKYALMKAAGRHADVCLLNTQDGWVAFGSDVRLIYQACGCFPLNSGLASKLSPEQFTFSSPEMPKALRRLTDAGHSVALLDYWSPSFNVKPQPTLIVRLEGKEDWI